MAARLDKKTLFSKIISGFTAISFIFSSIPTGSFAQVDKLRTNAGRAGGIAGIAAELQGLSGDRIPLEDKTIFGPPVKVTFVNNHGFLTAKELTIGGNPIENVTTREFGVGKLKLSEFFLNQEAVKAFYAKCKDLRIDGSKLVSYWMYRNLRPETAEKHEIREDITVIPYLEIAGQPIFTSGHYHPGNFPEVYVVLSGKALYYLQKKDANGNITDAVLVEAEAGDVVVIPPGYGHITIPKEDLVMMNWVSDKFESQYDEIIDFKGGAYKFKKEAGGSFSAVENENYRNNGKKVAPLRKGKVSDKLALAIGLPKGKPVDGVVDRSDDLEKLKTFLKNPFSIDDPIYNEILGRVPATAAPVSTPVPVPAPITAPVVAPVQGLPVQMPSLLPQILALINSFKLPEGKATSSYNYRQALEKKTDGADINHSEERVVIESNMKSMLESISHSISLGESSEGKAKWVKALGLEGLAKEDIETTLPWLADYTKFYYGLSGERSSANITANEFKEKYNSYTERLYRKLTNQIQHVKLRTIVELSKEYQKQYGVWLTQQIVVCVGETKEQRDRGNDIANRILIEDTTEIIKGFKETPDIDPQDLKLCGVRIANEARWLIGSKGSDIPDEMLKLVNESNGLLKNTLMPFLHWEIDTDYGAGTDKDSIKKLVGLEYVNGFLIGTAGKKVAELESVINHVEEYGRANNKFFNVGVNWKAENKRTGLDDVEKFSAMLKRKDFSNLRVVISANSLDLSSVKNEMVLVNQYLAKTHPKAENLIYRLENSIKSKDVVARKQVIEEIRGINPEIKNFLDLFLIGETGKIDDYLLTALKTRLLKEFAPEKAPRRVAIIGTAPISLLAVRAAMSKEFINEIDLVALISGSKDSTDKILPGIIVNSIHGTFRGRAKEAGNGAFINFDAVKQKKAVRVIKESALSGNLADNTNWKELGIDTIIIDRGKFDSEIKPDGLKKLNAQGIQVVINDGASVEGAVAYVPGVVNEKETQKKLAIGVASAEETAAVLGVKAVEELGKRVQIVNCRVIRKQDSQKQPTYSIAGSDQISHQKTEELRKIIASSLNIDLQQVTSTDEMKVPVAHGARLELSVGVDSKVSVDHVIAHFKKLAEELDILSVQEDGVILTSNLAWKKRRIQFDNDKGTLSTQDYPGGTLVNIAFLIDEESMPVDFLMRAIAKRSSFKEKKEIAAAAKESYASSAIETENERKTKELKEKTAEEKANKQAKKVGEVKEAKKRVIKDASLAATPDLLKEKKLLLGPDLDAHLSAQVLTDTKGSPVALVSIDFDKNIIKASSLLAPVSLEKTQEAFASYYGTLRDFALKLSAEKGGSAVEVLDNYKPEEKLRIKFSVNSNELQNTILKSVEQFKDNNWVALCEPNMSMNSAQFKDKYNVVLIGPGGRIGSLTFKLASEFANLNVIAVSGPQVEALAEFLERKDYVQGAFEGKIERGQDSITLTSQSLNERKTSIVFSNRVSNAFRDTANLPLGAFMFAGANIHLVEDATGRDYSTAALDEYRKLGSLRAVATAPGEGDGWSNNTFVLGVNDYKYDPLVHYIDSFASCTTGAATTSNLGMEIAIAIKKGLISLNDINTLPIEELKKKIYEAVGELSIYEYAETVHAFTGEELASDKIADTKKRTRNISGHDNILQTSSGMSKAVVPVDNAQVSIGGMAVRVPADTGSLLLQYFVLPGKFSKDEILTGYQTLKLISNYVALEDIDDSGVIKNVERLRRMMATISPSKMEVVNFKNAKGEDMSFISVAPWYENEKYYGFEVVNQIEKMRQREPKENFLVMGDDGRLKPLKLAEKKEKAEPKKQVSSEKVDLSAFRSLGELSQVIKAKNIDTAIIDVDYNLSRKLVLTKTGDIIDQIEDDEPISASLDTIDQTLEDVDFVFIPTSSGRPKGQYQRASEMQPIVDRFTELKADGKFKHLTGAVVVLLPVDLKEAEKTVDEAKKKFSGQKIIFFYENLRFYSAEESTSPEVRKKFAQRLIKITGRPVDKLAIINEAFEKNHRGEENASIEMLSLFPEENRAAGVSLLESIGKLLKFVNSVTGSWSVIPGGAKFDKWENIGELSKKVAEKNGTMLVVGAMVDPYLDSLGIAVGKSLMPTDEKELKKVKSGLKKLKASGAQVIAPTDFIVKGLTEPQKSLAGGLVQIDIGPESSKRITEYIESLKAGDGLVLNGGAGIFDNDELNAKEGTRSIILAAKDAALRGVVVFVIGKDMKVAKDKIVATMSNESERNELMEIINTKFINLDGGGVVWTALAKGIQNLSAVAAVMKTNVKPQEKTIAPIKPVDFAPVIQNIINQLQLKFNIPEANIKKFFTTDLTSKAAIGGAQFDELVDTLAKAQQLASQEASGELKINAWKSFKENGDIVVSLELEAENLKQKEEVFIAKAKAGGANDSEMIDQRTVISEVNGRISDIIKDGKFNIRKKEDYTALLSKIKNAYESNSSVGTIGEEMVDSVEKGLSSLREQLLMNRHAIVISPEFFKLAGATSTLLKAIELAGDNFQFVLYGQGADNFRDLLGTANKNIVIGDTLAAAISGLDVSPGNILALVSSAEAKEDTGSLKIKKLVFTKNSVSTDVLAMGITSVLDNSDANNASEKFYAAIADVSKGIVAHEDFAEAFIADRREVKAVLNSNTVDSIVLPDIQLTTAVKDIVKAAETNEISEFITNISG